ncbi:MAG: hypothetical protein ACRD0C_20985 [Acidimicrobiia bacterium]
MSAGVPSRSERDLTERERRILADAHAELRQAVEAYEPFLGKELRPGEPVPVVSADGMRAAQERVEAAEDRLWQLRERLLGWARPAWAPRASLVSDWFSDEDADYDQVIDPVRP